ncbi:hypothetical protein VP01_876g2 [Puccinia sorghi]|uniref:Uncharacterized protein n=1 Tax=Puccinia sorghi TaxID=27349 RepID=A0A0L6U8J0_9BASI|nr:hypothetical protein VP01_876g2 [Puccinia sorghi]
MAQKHQFLERTSERGSSPQAFKPVQARRREGLDCSTSDKWREVFSHAKTDGKPTNFQSGRRCRFRDEQEELRALQSRYKAHPEPRLDQLIRLPPHDPTPPPIQTTRTTVLHSNKMQFTAAVVVALACSSSVSAFFPSLAAFGNPLTGAMSGCGNQAGFVNVGALNENSCNSAGGPGGISCGNQAGGLINVALLNSNNCASMASGPLFQNGPLFQKSDVSFHIPILCINQMSSEYYG